MAKKKAKLNLTFIVSVVAALLAVVAFFMMFAPAAGIDKTETTYTGAQMTFGYSEKDMVIFSFSFLNLLPYILLVAGIVFNFLTKFCKFSNFISAGCYLVAAVLFFLVIVCSVLGEGFDAILGIGSIFAGKESGKDVLTLGAGAIVAGVLAILSAIASAAAMFIKK